MSATDASKSGLQWAFSYSKVSFLENSKASMKSSFLGGLYKKRMIAESLAATLGF